MRSKAKLAALLLLAALPLAAQQPPSDAPPSIKLGALVFADYTYTASVSPAAHDANGREIHPNAFNITRAYINLTGNLNRYLSFRVTPDIARESGSGSSLSGSQEYRLKYAYAQWNLERWLTKGSWVRAGVTQTPWIDFEESIYRYRFQGPIMLDREGYLSSADGGVSMRYALPGEYGDIQGGVYNGENYAHSEPNNEKAFMLRAAVRPLAQTPVLKGLRVAAFVDRDRYTAGQPRDRNVAQISFEHPRVIAAVDFLTARDQRTASVPVTRGRGYSAWANPKLAGRWEMLLRRDVIKPDTSVRDRRTRDIEGIAYWFPVQSGVSSALMLDRDATRGPAAGTHATNYGLKLLVNF